MTRDQFIAYARAYLDDLEGVYDQIAEHNGEVARFGDAGPGSYLRLSALIRQVNRIERQLARLESRAPRDFHLALRAPL